jgi:hypothetical protein
MMNSRSSAIAAKSDRVTLTKDEDQAICSTQPEPRWRRPLQDNKLLPEKRHLGFASHMRSEHSDEQSAE